MGGTYSHQNTLHPLGLEAAKQVKFNPGQVKLHSRRLEANQELKRLVYVLKVYAQPQRLEPAQE